MNTPPPSDPRILARTAAAPRSSPALRRLGPAGAVVAAILLAGCAVGPDYRPPSMQVPGGWGSPKNPVAASAADAARRPPDLARWWTRLDDGLLDALMGEAVAGNLDVAAAKARVRQARAIRREALGALAPSITGTGDYTRASDGNQISDTGDLTVTGPYDSWDLGLNASWELDLFGANRRAAEAAKYGLDAAEEDLRATLLTLVGDVATTYVEARGYQARLALARRTAASQRETAALTRTKLEAGSASAVDVANAEGQAASTEANIPQLQSSYQQSINALSVLLGQPPTSLDARMKKVRPIPAPSKPVPKGVPADVLLSRPDVRLAERQLAEYTAKIGQAEAARYPDVSLVGAVSTSATKLGDVAQGSSISWSFGPSVTVPIFNAGQLAAEVDYAKALRDAYFVAYRSTVLTALQDVENAGIALTQERIRNRSLSASAASYRQAASLARVLYQAGSSSFLDVLDAERSLYTAEDSYLQSRVAITTDYVALNKALGGGWDGGVDTGRPEIVDDMGPRFVQANWIKEFASRP